MKLWWRYLRQALVYLDSILTDESVGGKVLSSEVFRAAGAVLKCSIKLSLKPL
jgi:hypothetical protein